MAAIVSIVLGADMISLIALQNNCGEEELTHKHYNS